jgi:hypothetical protein
LYGQNGSTEQDVVEAIEYKHKVILNRIQPPNQNILTLLETMQRGIDDLSNSVTTQLTTLTTQLSTLTTDLQTNQFTTLTTNLASAELRGKGKEYGSLSRSRVTSTTSRSKWSISDWISCHRGGFETP